MSDLPTVVVTHTREMLRSSYEDLRRLALTDGGSHRGAGFALFVRSGMGSWMETCAELPAMPVVAPVAAPTRQAPSVPNEIRFEIALVLAQMALSAHSQGATTS